MREDSGMDGAEVDRSIPFVETHHHLWKLGNLTYDWLTDVVHDDGRIAPKQDATEVLGDYRMIRTDWPMERLLHEFHGSNVIRSVHIEAGYGYGGYEPVAETEWLETVADEHGFPHAFVVYVDVTADGAGALIERHMAASSRVRGLRPQTHPVDWDIAPFRDAMETLGRHGLSYELNTSVEGMDAGRSAALAFADTQVILGHAGLPTERSDEYRKRWQRGMASLAEAPNVACKVSGLGMFDHHWTIESLRPWVLGCIEAFGVERIMFGTNWPVDVVYSSYLRQVDAWRTIIAEAGFSRDEQAAMLHGNAERLYRI